MYRIYHEQGNFDLVVENDDLDQAVAYLSSRLTEWFPKIKNKNKADGENGDAQETSTS